ncbi:hypothetical protein E4V42_05385 [Clostridium estertheticum]|uniref:Uncharacterized protein n=1 Tax=Clostridium estertheticum TaxID=238834 RepID=A0A5N7IYH6_9CLOT|nr:amidohydrolase [Clostridium estertheticum]MPQ30869.1 hypothetical protein [Clostridium estertheticum]MPQ61545.1 hypothetical protein [Clostridium estertheticum]
MCSKVIVSTGMVATLNSGDACITVRTNMDSLTVRASSHGCENDYHMAVVLNTAIVLKQLGFNKVVKFIFEPGEEIIGGAVSMIM